MTLPHCHPTTDAPCPSPLRAPCRLARRRVGPLLGYCSGAASRPRQRAASHAQLQAAAIPVRPPAAAPALRIAQQIAACLLASPCHWPPAAPSGRGFAATRSQLRRP
uniref:Uncharacterized protein n=1 Tax=Setaria italica TaxID=4555 RepID=K3ZB05_SETIT